MNGFPNNSEETDALSSCFQRVRPYLIHLPDDEDTYAGFARVVMGLVTIDNPENVCIRFTNFHRGYRNCSPGVFTNRLSHHLPFHLHSFNLGIRKTPLFKHKSGNRISHISMFCTVKGYGRSNKPKANSPGYRYHFLAGITPGTGVKEGKSILPLTADLIILTGKTHQNMPVPGTIELAEVQGLPGTQCQATIDNRHHKRKSHE